MTKTASGLVRQSHGGYWSGRVWDGSGATVAALEGGLSITEIKQELVKMAHWAGHRTINNVARDVDYKITWLN